MNEEIKNEKGKNDIENNRNSNTNIEEMSCDIIKDLLPLYADGACSEDSEKMVEEHLKECPYCERLFKEMTVPLAIPEISPKEIKMQKVFKKIWFTFLIVVGLLAVIVTGKIVLECMEFHNEIYEDGITAENWDDVKIVEKVMSKWQETGIKEAVALMKPVELYFSLSEPLTHEELNQWAGQWFEERPPRYETVEIAGERFSMLLYGEQEEMEQPWENPPNYETPTTQAGWDMQKALEAKDYVCFWHIFMQEYKEQMIVTEAIYEAVTDRYDDVIKENYHKLELDSGNYYYYDEIEENGSRNIGFSDFAADMYEKVENLEPVDDTFFVCAQSRYMPENLCVEFMEDYKLVRDKFTEYTAYYQNLGYYNFADQWRGKIETTVMGLEKQGVALEGYEVIRVFQPDNPDYYGWRVMCRADFSNGYSLYLYFDVNNGRCTLDDAGSVYQDGMSDAEKAELEELEDVVFECLDYRIYVP